MADSKDIAGVAVRSARPEGESDQFGTDSDWAVGDDSRYACGCCTSSGGRRKKAPMRVNHSPGQFQRPRSDSRRSPVEECDACDS